YMVNISWRRWIMREQSKIFKLCFGAMFVELTAIGANITSIVLFLVVGGVPITLQSFFAVYDGLDLVCRVGSYIMFEYIMLGVYITSIVLFFVLGCVPITLQTFFAVLAGLVLGSRVGAFSMFVYMMLGLVGAPVFAQFKGGMGMLLSPTFGFILSFILIAYVA